MVFSITISLQIEGQIEQKYKFAKLSALTTHGPIDIKSNADFNNYAVISGIGSSGDLYLIDRFRFRFSPRWMGDSTWNQSK